jgi:hypothetical protein
MLQNLKNFLHQVIPGRKANPVPGTATVQTTPSLKAIGLADFFNISVPPREMLLSPILPERSLAMLYAPRGIGKSWLGAIHWINRRCWRAVSSPPPLPHRVNARSPLAACCRPWNSPFGFVG